MYNSNARAVFAPFKGSGLSYNPISALGKLCGLSQLGRGNIELNI